MFDADLFEQLGPEIVSVLAARARTRGLLLADFPRLTSKGFAHRMNALVRGHGIGKVNFPRALKMFVSAYFPEFQFCGHKSDQHLFEKQLLSGLKIILIFERIHHFGLGKAYTVQLGCSFTVDKEKSLLWKHSLFHFFDRESLEWTYGTAEDLEACLQETANLLRLVIPGYEATWQSVSTTDRVKLFPNSIERGPLSFHEAAEIAYRALLTTGRPYSRVDGAWLRQELPVCANRLWVRRTASAATSGRLSPGQSWSIHFADLTAERTVTVRIPYRGDLSFTLSDTLRVNRSNVHHLLHALPDPAETLALPALSLGTPVEKLSESEKSWMGFANSPEVMTLVLNAGGSEFLNRHSECQVNLKLDAEISDPPAGDEYWFVDCWAADHEHRLTARVSARDRKVSLL